MKYLHLKIKYNPKAAVVSVENGEISLSVNTEHPEHVTFEVSSPGGKTIPAREYSVLVVGPRGGLTLY